MLIEEIEKIPTYSDIENTANKTGQIIWNNCNESFTEKFRSFCKSNDPLCQINCDGIHSDNCEEERPFLEVQDINHILE